MRQGTSRRMKSETFFLNSEALEGLNQRHRECFMSSPGCTRLPMESELGARVPVCARVGARGREGTSTSVTHTAAADAGFCELRDPSGTVRVHSFHTNLASAFHVTGPLAGTLPTTVDEVSTTCVYIHGVDVPCARHP